MNDMDDLDRPVLPTTLGDWAFVALIVVLACVVGYSIIFVWFLV